MSKGVAAVAELKDRIFVHVQLRDNPCVLCGLTHEQQYITAALFDEDRYLGDICPRCVSAGPAEAAKRLQALLAQPLPREEKPRKVIDCAPPRYPRLYAGGQAKGQAARNLRDLYGTEPE